MAITLRYKLKYVSDKPQQKKIEFRNILKHCGFLTLVVANEFLEQTQLVLYSRVTMYSPIQR